ncbi:Zinc finger BED domain-containing protein RICESLEEPER 2 [Linum perenne]
MKTANPLYQRVTRSTTTTDVFSTYDIFKGKVKGILKHVQRMSLTTDMWTSNQTMQYMVVTGHFIDKNWKLQKRILNFCGVPPPHTGIVLADALQKCLVAWDVESKIWSITLDNASNNDVAVRHLKSMLTYTRRLPLDGDLFHVRCGAHIINIMVQYGLKAIEDTIESVRQSVKHIAASEGRISMFRDIAKQLRLSPKKLILDCSTRWNSTHHMLSVALELKDFSYITTIISGSSYPTINLLLPELWNIKTLLSETMESEDERMKVMAIKMLEKFDKYWGATLESIKDPEFNVIDWWKSERTKYKILSKMACEIMAIPITSVASEAAFSAGGRVIDPSRSSLGQKTIEALLCSQDWLRNHYGLTSGSKVSFLLTFISVIVQINM